MFPTTIVNGDLEWNEGVAAAFSAVRTPPVVGVRFTKRRRPMTSHKGRRQLPARVPEQPPSHHHGPRSRSITLEPFAYSMRPTSPEWRLVPRE